MFCSKGFAKANWRCPEKEISSLNSAGEEEAKITGDKDPDPASQSLAYAQGMDTVKKIAESLGIKHTASGTATLSGEIEPQAWSGSFTEGGRNGHPQPPDQRLGGPVANVLLCLSSPSLRDKVENITIVPPYILMKSPSESSTKQS